MNLKKWILEISLLYTVLEAESGFGFKLKPISVTVPFGLHCSKQNLDHISGFAY